MFFEHVILLVPVIVQHVSVSDFCFGPYSSALAAFFAVLFPP